MRLPRSVCTNRTVLLNLFHLQGPLWRIYLQVFLCLSRGGCRWGAADDNQSNLLWLCSSCSESWAKTPGGAYAYPGLATCLPHKGGGVRLSALLNKSVEDRIVFMRQNCVCDNCAKMITFLNFVSHFQHARLLIVLTNIIIYFTEKSKLTGL